VPYRRGTGIRKGTGSKKTNRKINPKGRAKGGGGEKLQINEKGKKTGGGGEPPKKGSRWQFFLEDKKKFSTKEKKQARMIIFHMRGAKGVTSFKWPDVLGGGGKDKPQTGSN